MKTAIRNLLAPLHLKSSIKTLNKLEKQLVTAKARFAIPFIFRGKGHFKSIRCMQNQDELERLFNQVCELSPKRFLEIGTAKGGALYLWLQAAAKDAIGISIDLPDGEFGGGYPSCRVPFYQEFAKEDQKLHLLRASSHSEKTLEEVKRILNGEKLDALFIDGDHTYEGVKKDFELYAPLVRKGGLIGLHDILPRKDLPDIEVYRFWEELKSDYPRAMDIVGRDDRERKIGWGLVIRD